MTRHNIVVETFDPLNSLSVGNGDFAFTTDITGLQTFYKEYENGVPLGTQSNWGWHTIPNDENYTLSESTRMFTVNGRQVPYLHRFLGKSRNAAASEYFRENPHRLHLGLVRLVMKKSDGSVVEINDLEQINHQLNLWEGKITSEFKIENIPVRVVVFCHQEMDLFAAKIESPLISSGKLAIQWEFPYGTTKQTHPGYDFSVPEKHQSLVKESSNRQVVIKRILDDDQYHVSIQWYDRSELIQTGQHSFQLIPNESNNFIEFSCLFSLEEPEITLPDFMQTQSNNLKAWKHFWESGGAIDFSACSDPRAHELERRTILSQYLTKIQSSGSLPPAETGLTYNSWYGKFHLEMHWWHSVHFALWNRPEYLQRQLEYYRKIYDQAKSTAEAQGYKGVRWPKMVGPDGRESPSSVGTYLIWQQPHFIYYAELLYQNNPSKDVLNAYKDLVFATADFMAGFAQLDSSTQTYNLNPPLIPAQELWPRDTTVNPPFELAYWFWGLSTAQKWNQRLGLPENPEWEKVRIHLPAPVEIDGLYMGTAHSTDSYTNPRNMRDHPVVLGSYGILPLWDKIDPNIMRNTLNVILQKWNWPSTWGWDYPMVAMTTTRLGEPEKAIDVLLKDVQKNTYLVNGHNYQNERLRIYLPGNGGFLTTIGMMCAGWEGCEIDNPGFPKDGKWNVKWENISPMF